MFEDFNLDKKAGDELEQYLLAKYKTRYPLTYIADGYEPRWDIVIPEMNHSIECKRDEAASKTGNLAFEFSKYDNRPSGINTCEATIWAHYAFGTIFFMPFDKLKAWLQDGSFSIKQAQRGDKFYIVPLEEICKLSWMTPIRIGFLEEKGNV